MLRSFKLGRLFGIPLYVHTTFLLLPLWVLFNTGFEGVTAVLFTLALVAAVFGCVVLHELGHALMARYFGIGTRDITLYPIGGVARLDRMSERPAEELLIALAGPAVNLVIVLLLSPLVFTAALTGVLGGDGTAVSLAQGALTLLAKFAGGLWLSNVLLMGFNLLPAFPMDGGRVLRALLSPALGLLRATEIAAAVGMVTAVLMGLAGIYLPPPWNNPMLVVVAVFVYFAGQQELLALRRREAQRRMAALEPMPVVVTVGPAPTSGDPLPASPGLRDANFTGFVWDPSYRAWVQWLNGRPVGLPFGPTE
jgi:Zn-dependent protease